MSDLLVTLTVDQLRELVGKAMRDELSRATTAPVKEVFTLTEAAEFLERHPRQISKLIREEKLPAYYISDREPRFKRSELLDWLAARPRQPKESDG